MALFLASFGIKTRKERRKKLISSAPKERSKSSIPELKSCITKNITYKKTAESAVYFILNYQLKISDIMIDVLDVFIFVQFFNHRFDFRFVVIIEIDGFIRNISHFRGVEVIDSDFF